ncbi:hypothetical protein G6699_09170 [Polynucleobacter paneuropaeus]|jgi:hypothetical protein|nr:hypothetical protein [Polynucleobacter paneuropaeus]
MITILNKKITKKWFLFFLVILKISGVVFATMIFSRYTPLVDSNLYLKGYYSIDPSLRTKFIHYSAVFLNGLGGNFFAHFIFAIFSVVGLIYFCIAGGTRWVFLLFLLLPSSFVWTSIVGKEAVYFGAMGLVLVIWSKYALQDLSYVDKTLLFSGIVICILFRPHYSAALVWLFISTWIIKRGYGSIPLILIALFTLGAIAIYFLAWEQLLLRGFGGIDPLARASRFEYFGIDQGTSAGYLKFKGLVMLGIVYGMIGPLPSEIFARLEFLPFFIEGLLILFFPLFIWILVIKKSFRLAPQFLQIFYWSLVPAMFMLMIIHAPFGLMNPGSATRWRTDFDQIFYLAPLLLFFRFMDYEEKTNTTLSH